MTADAPPPFSVTWDEQADALYLRIAPEGATITDTTEVHPGVILDLAADGSVIGVEVLAVRRQAAEALHATPRQH